MFYRQFPNQVVYKPFYRVRIVHGRHADMHISRLYDNMGVGFCFCLIFHEYPGYFLSVLVIAMTESPTGIRFFTCLSMKAGKGINSTKYTKRNAVDFLKSK